MISKDTRSYYLKCGILAKWHDKTLEQFVNDPHTLSLIKGYIANAKYNYSNGVGFFLIGDNGVGKSHLLNCVMMKMIVLGYTAKVVSFSSMISSFAGGWYSEEDNQKIREMKSVKFLAIEEIGKEYRAKDNELAVKTLDNIVRHRVQMNLPTLYTSNIKASELANLYSVDIASMLKESSVAITVTGIDYRDVVRETIKTNLFKQKL